MKDCIKCKDCKYFNTWRTLEGTEKHGQIYECSKLVISSPSPDDYCSKAERKEDQKFGKWIPVSERLPEDAQEVLYSTKTGRVFHGEYYDDNTDRKWFSYKDDIFSFNNVVTAWMPLPKPYEPQEGANE